MHWLVAGDYDTAVRGSSGIHWFYLFWGYHSHCERLLIGATGLWEMLEMLMYWRDTWNGSPWAATWKCELYKHVFFKMQFQVEHGIQHFCRAYTTKKVFLVGVWSSIIHNFLCVHAEPTESEICRYRTFLFSEEYFDISRFSLLIHCRPRRDGWSWSTIFAWKRVFNPPNVSCTSTKKTGGIQAQTVLAPPDHLFWCSEAVYSLHGWFGAERAIFWHDSDLFYVFELPPTRLLQSKGTSTVTGTSRIHDIEISRFWDLLDRFLIWLKNPVPNFRYRLNCQPAIRIWIPTSYPYHTIVEHPAINLCRGVHTLSLDSIILATMPRILVRFLKTFFQSFWHVICRVGVLWPGSRILIYLPDGTMPRILVSFL